jgi:tryptophan-rich sensory protein
MFTNEDAIKVLGVFVFVFWQKSKLTTREIRDIYGKKKAQLCCSPPEWFFGLAWFILFGCMFVAGYFLIYSDALIIDNNQFIGLFVTYFVAVYLTKEWMSMFFDNENPQIAIYIDVICFMSTLTFIVLCGYNHLWISFSVMIPVLIQLFVAGIWNWQWITNGILEDKKKGKPMNSSYKTPYIKRGNNPKILNI